MDGIWLWVVIALIAAIGEVLTTGLFLAPFAVAAVLVAFLSPVLPVLAVQVAVFAALSFVGVVVFRPFARHALGWDREDDAALPMPNHHLIEKRAVVTVPVDATGGQIRIGQGEFWSARSFDPDDHFTAGTPVEVVYVDGVTAVVGPVPEPALEAPSVEEGRS
ncbi:MAG TPA: NfeD family protein [Chloroflexota bacterium]|nr:NfeD family protein [Chloroflexota bacterium]